MKFKEYCQDQLWLIPPDINSLIPEDDFVRTLNRIVEEFDLTEILSCYQEEGNPAHHPRMMLKILFFAYSSGIYSSRKIAQALHRDIYFWYLSARQYPDFRTICRFRNRHARHVENLFAQLLRMCNERGMISLENVAIDGTIIQADASKDRLYKKRNQDKQIQDHVQQIMKKCRELDDQEGLLESTDSNSPADNNHGTAKVDNDCKLMRNTDGGFRPAYNAQALVDERCQVIVSATVITSNDRYGIEDQMEQLHRTHGRYPTRILADAGYWNAHNFIYLAEKNVEGLIAEGNIYKRKKADKKKQEIYSKEQFVYEASKDVYTCPAGHTLHRSKDYWHGRKDALGRTKLCYSYYNNAACTGCPQRSACTRSTACRVIQRVPGEELVEAAKQCIRSERGQALYKRRKCIVEPVFADIKCNLKLTRFNVRGQIKVKAQYLMACCIHNIKKIHRWGTGTDPGSKFSFILNLFCPLIRLSPLVY